MTEEKQTLAEFKKILKKRKPRFIRKDSFKISKLGKRRKKKQKWRKPRGRHSKLREKRTGHMIQPSIGWSSPKAVRGFVQESKPVLVYNLSDLENLKHDEIAVIGKVGKKKKIEIIEKAVAKNIKILNVNTNKFLKKARAEKEARAKDKEKAKKLEEEKKAKEKKVEKKEEKKKEKEEPKSETMEETQK